jgi:uncharacterized membrane protein YesL
MLSRSLKMAFWVIYDHTGKLILASLLWSLVPAIPLYFAWLSLMSQDPVLMLATGLPCVAAAFGVALPLMSTGMAHLIKVLIDKRDGEFRDFFRGIALHWRRTIAIGAMYAAASACLAASALFYPAFFNDASPLFGYCIGAAAIWCLAFLGLSAMYVAPAIVQRNGTARETVRIAAMICLANPVLTLGLAAQILLIGIVSLAMLPLFIALFGAIAMALASSAYELLSRKYARIAAEKNGGDAMVAILDDSQDDYLNRGFRDFLFPWKS